MYKGFSGVHLRGALKIFFLWKGREREGGRRVTLLGSWRGVRVCVCVWRAGLSGVLMAAFVFLLEDDRSLTFAFILRRFEVRLGGAACHAPPPLHHLMAPFISTLICIPVIKIPQRKAAPPRHLGEINEALEKETKVLQSTTRIGERNGRSNNAAAASRTLQASKSKSSLCFD